ncbi:HAD family hydrolase [Candidatus Amesbacteria bacterium RIFCSPHIGHO2_01_FULL_48_32]|uniref:HAD family hydrolase n=1 Tax=Candidatus Amesbacteria bacterium RIFCSPLOWO2_01_FULL_48_25 TaxID=1797259 RepID=A0A1F4ZCB2_9BACT|nr:MAG: HAD family hydrolase [Candidatus Amesbacteria bacterium RIFCSPHIGHO2_01_FULL_48_32]OGD03989.1 MAG: HAD family hydrolase [Candidatus Amesbacteria bacterium RIFCSPLOWO2_01_FULL_48_25]HJZ05748.1 HAD family phosphatase [Patescibacteria group bacterium]
MLKAIIFDLDGVLVDATEWHYEALNKALKLFGQEIGREEHLKVYNGLPTNEKLKILSDRGELPRGVHEIIKVLKRRYTDEIVNTSCQPSHEKLIMLSYLKKLGYTLACCSNAQKYSVDNMLKRSMLDTFFDQIIGNDEGYQPKPAPDIYLAAFAKMKLNPQETVVVEDAPHGILAAKASGANVIEVRGFHEVNLSLFERHGII